jgi:enolase
MKVAVEQASRAELIELVKQLLARVQLLEDPLEEVDWTQDAGYSTEEVDPDDLRERERLLQWRKKARNIAAALFLILMIEAAAVIFILHWLRHTR